MLATAVEAVDEVDISSYVTTAQLLSRRRIQQSFYHPIAWSSLWLFICIVIEIDLADSIYFFVRFVIPTIALCWINSVINSLILVITEMATLNIQKLRRELECAISSEKESGTIGEYFWTHMLKKYLALDRHLKRACAALSNLVFTQVALNLAIAWPIGLVGFSTFQSQPWLGTVSYFVVGYLLCSIMKSLYPLALLNTRCISTTTKKPSLFMNVLLCGEREMSSDQNTRYLKFLEVVKCCPLGAKFPLLGIITTSDMLNYAKLIACFVPAALTYSLVALHDSRHRD